MYYVPRTSCIIAKAQLDRKGDVQALRAMLRLDNIVNIRDSLGNTGMHVAAMANRVVMGEQLLRHGALHARVDRRGRTALHIACRAGAFNFVDMLLRKTDFRGNWVDVDAIDCDGLSPMMLAAAGGHANCVDILFRVGRADRSLSDKDGQTALDIAESHGHAQVSNLLRGKMSLAAKSKQLAAHEGAKQVTILTFNRIGRSWRPLALGQVPSSKF